VEVSVLKIWNHSSTIILTVKFKKMKKLISLLVIIMIAFTISSCKKSNVEPLPDNHFNLDVVLKGTQGSGTIKFRQDSDTAKLITLDTEVRGLIPYHEYKLQRAVDTNIDGNCTGTAWLTLGKGLQAQSIFTDGYGKDAVHLWRSVAALAAGTMFDIHFQIIDAVTMDVVLKSDCYQYTVR